MTDVAVYFYGGLINPQVQKNVGLTLGAPAVATLRGFRLTFEPYVNLRPQPDGIVYGLIANVDRDTLAGSYGRLAVTYDPVPVIVELADGSPRPALCYIASAMPDGPLDEAHIENLAVAADQWDFPRDYVDMIRGHAARARGAAKA